MSDRKRSNHLEDILEFNTAYCKKRDKVVEILESAVSEVQGSIGDIKLAEWNEDSLQWWHKGLHDSNRESGDERRIEYDTARRAHDEARRKAENRIPELESTLEGLRERADKLADTFKKCMIGMFLDIFSNNPTNTKMDMCDGSRLCDVWEQFACVYLGCINPTFKWTRCGQADDWGIDAEGIFDDSTVGAIAQAKAGERRGIGNGTVLKLVGSMVLKNVSLGFLVTRWKEITDNTRKLVGSFAERKYEVKVILRSDIVYNVVHGFRGDSDDSDNFDDEVDIAAFFRKTFEKFEELKDCDWSINKLMSVCSNIGQILKDIENRRTPVIWGETSTGGSRSHQDVESYTSDYSDIDIERVGGSAQSETHE